MVQKSAKAKKAAPRSARAVFDPVRTFSVRIPASVLHQVKMKADKLGLKLQGVSRQALSMWAGDDVQAALLQPFGEMTAEERRILSAALELLRGDPDMASILRALAKRHTRESGRSAGAGS